MILFTALPATRTTTTTIAEALPVEARMQSRQDWFPLQLGLMVVEGNQCRPQNLDSTLKC